MRLSSLVAVLSTLLLVDSAVAEPIPIHAKVYGQSPAPNTKRWEDELLTKDGWAIRYWAWSRVAYDKEWNSGSTKRPLKHEQIGGGDRDWVFLADHKIEIRGIVGEATEYDSANSDQPAPIIMKTVIGLDETKKEIVIAFKGTDDYASAKQDTKYYHSKLGEIEGQLHMGFAQCFQSVMGSITEILKEYRASGKFANYSIVFTGHSLGGATALIAASYFTTHWNDMKDEVWVFTYGAPRAGDKKFQEDLQKKLGSRMFNFMHIKDPVTIMPWISAGYANPASRFVFEPTSSSDSWFDNGNWHNKPVPDTDKAEFEEAVPNMVKTAWDRLYHTGYFQDDKVKVKRDIQESRSVHKHQKRQAPTQRELERADGYIEQIVTLQELKYPAREAPSAFWSLAKSLHLEDDAQTLWSDIQDRQNEEDRHTYLMLIRAFAEEHA